MKLGDALFQEPALAYQVLGEIVDFDDPLKWDLRPLAGSTLAAEDVDDQFQGLFVISALLVSSDEPPQPCYLDLVLPERIAEHHFLRVDDGVTMRRGRMLPEGTVIPAIGIEAFGLYKLFFAKENPSTGIEVLKNGVKKARHPEDIALDLALLLRDEKRYEEAIEAFTTFLEENRRSELDHTAYEERSKLYAAINKPREAAADRLQYSVAFEKYYGHAPAPKT